MTIELSPSFLSGEVHPARQKETRMDSSNHVSNKPALPAPPPSAANSDLPRRPYLWLLLLTLSLVVCGAVALAIRFGSSKSAPQSDGILVVFVRPQGTGEALQIEAEGALPVRSSGNMNLDVQYRKPACTYLVWLDSVGKAVPLYPWNNSKVEVADLSSPPPVRRPGQVVQSPNSIGGAWPFRPGSGMETVLLLSRSTPLPDGTSVGKLLGEVPQPVAVRDEKELVIMEVRDHAKAVTTVLSRDRGDEVAAKAADEPLKALLLRLAPHFDLVRAVRFAHVADEPK